MEFDEGNMKRVKNAVRGLVPEAVSFGLRSVSNENARDRMVVNLWIVGGDERESATPDLTEVRQRGLATIP